MPVVRDIPLNLDVKEMLRRSGVKEQSRVRPEIRNSTLELLKGVEEESLIEPAMAYEIFPLDSVNREQSSPEGSHSVKWSLLSSLFPEAKELAVIVCTIGLRLEERVTYYFKNGEPLRGTLLDGIGTAAVDLLSQECCRFIIKDASPRGFQASSPISPGMPCFPITEQWWLLELVPSREIGVSLTTSGIMVPRKSTSMVIGIGQQMITWTQDEVCARCNLREDCLYRIHE